jgi:hypothetical protein
MPKRFSKVARFWAYQLLCQRDGEHCQHCGAVPTNPISAARNEVNSAAGGVSYIPSAAPQRRTQKGDITLEIDHINEDKSDDRPENLQLLCKPCNVAKGNRARSRRPSDLSVCVRERMRAEGCAGTRVGKAVVRYGSGSAEMQAAQMYELPFRGWLMGVLRSADFVEKEDAINSGAEITGASVPTINRYLKKLTSSAGPLKEARDAVGGTVIMMKPEFVE